MCWVRAEGGTGRRPGREQGGPPSSPPPFTFVAPGEGGPGAPAAVGPPRRAPDSAAPRAAPPGGRGWGCWPSLRTEPGLLHLSCLGHARGLYNPQFRVQGSSPHPVLSHAQGRSAAPSSLPGGPSFQTETERVPALRDRLAGCPEVGGRASAGTAACCPTQRCEEKAPGKSQVSGTGDSLRWAVEGPSHFLVHCALKWV